MAAFEYRSVIYQIVELQGLCALVKDDALDEWGVLYPEGTVLIFDGIAAAKAEMERVNNE